MQPATNKKVNWEKEQVTVTGTCRDHEIAEKRGCRLLIQPYLCSPQRRCRIMHVKGALCSAYFPLEDFPGNADISVAPLECIS
jgi:hypothetical protein